MEMRKKIIMILVVLAFITAMSGIVAGGGGKPDFKFDFIAAAPFTYTHATGGGAYNDRTIGIDKDVEEELEQGEFQCGDWVTHFVEIEVDDSAASNQVIDLDFSFLGDTTGQSGIAYDDIDHVRVNYGSVENGDGGTPPGGGVGVYDTDSGNKYDDGLSTAALISESITGTIFNKGARVLGTVRITDLDAGEHVVVRLDARLACNGQIPTGNLQAKLEDGRQTSTGDKLNVGSQTVPLKSSGAGIIPEFPTIALPIAAVLGLVFLFKSRKKKEE